MTDITIPPAALEVGARAAYETYWRLQAEAVGMNPADLEPWDYHDAPTQEEWRTLARAAFEAMVASWPGMDTIMLPRMMQPGHFVPQDYIRLPLTEKQDDRP